MLYANRDSQPGNVQSEGDAWTDLSNLGYRQIGSGEERAVYGDGAVPISGVVAQAAYEDTWRLAGNGAFLQNLLATENGWPSGEASRAQQDLAPPVRQDVFTAVERDLAGFLFVP